MNRRVGLQDQLVSELDRAIRMLFTSPTPNRLSPAEKLPDPNLKPNDRLKSIALMRVNHAGEISAQALYSGQAIMARSKKTRVQLLGAAEEEQDHLAWYAERLAQLEGKSSRLDPLWYLGSFCVGILAGAPGDSVSLGFVAETEKQVEAHIEDHLERLPKTDTKSAAILKRMASDEAHHRTTAQLSGGTKLPALVRFAMTCGGGILRRIALWI